MTKPATRTNALNQRISLARADQSAAKYADQLQPLVRELENKLVIATELLERKDDIILELAKQNREMRARIVELESGGALKQ